VEGPVPKHVQLLRILEEYITARTRIDDPLPSERELMLTYDVGRSTVREATEGLIRRGLAYRVPGKGTFVGGLSPMTSNGDTPPDTRRSLNMLSFSQELLARNLTPSTTVLVVEQILNPAIADRLVVPPATTLVMYSRLRLGDGIPMAIQTSYLDSTRMGNSVLDQLTTAGSLYAVLSQYEITPARAVESYRAITVSDADVCLHLGMKPGSAAFSVERTTFDQNGVVCEYATSILNPTMYTLEIELG
jgi:GntR family transcriptional regulator